jgi:hypothetical protein
MNAARSLAPSDFRACAIDQAPRENPETLAGARQHSTPPLRCIIDVGMASRGSKQLPPKRGASINARDSIAGQSTAQK